MTCQQLAVSPNIFEMGSLETLPLTFDTTPILLPGETVAWAQAQLIQVDNGQDYSTAGLIGPVAIAGNELTATVTSLLPRKRYRLTIQFEVAANKDWAPYLLIECPA
jgi:hypothetical protein